MIQTYKIMNNIDRIDGKKFFKPCKEVRTRGHSKGECRLGGMSSNWMSAQWNRLDDCRLTESRLSDRYPIQRELKKLNVRASSGAMHSAKEWRMTGMHCQMLSL